MLCSMMLLRGWWTGAVHHRENVEKAELQRLADFVVRLSLGRERYCRKCQEDERYQQDRGEHCDVSESVVACCVMTNDALRPGIGVAKSLPDSLVTCLAFNSYVEPQARYLHRSSHLNLGSSKDHRLSS